ncbi:hypothetical protein H7J51_17905 [Mycobacterium crocinum]|uniref:Uncharacterized protein n=1 Tax=Mycolicibacterium crocinum TaxID=388459 RepID=A0ABY3TN59_9MYCO|nr:hypothetical protein [Mycolicibacterium crocinum]MCV7217148.1 hypothetical protein [Mycolicibacterium crocinum]ULN42892.1 hypothetical protein MI149_07310 [Mycolicibacterium crocinum]
MSEPSFQVALAPYLVAVGDGARLRVYRSLAVSAEAPAYKPVADYIEENGMVLVSSETGRHDGMFGRTEQSHYATPEARMLWLATTEEENKA